MLKRLDLKILVGVVGFVGLLGLVSFEIHLLGGGPLSSEQFFALIAIDAVVVILALLLCGWIETKLTGRLPKTTCPYCGVEVDARSEDYLRGFCPHCRERLRDCPSCE